MYPIHVYVNKSLAESIAALGGAGVSPAFFWRARPSRPLPRRDARDALYKAPAQSSAMIEKSIQRVPLM